MSEKINHTSQKRPDISDLSFFDRVEGKIEKRLLSLVTNPYFIKTISRLVDATSAENDKTPVTIGPISMFIELPDKTEIIGVIDLSEERQKRQNQKKGSDPIRKLGSTKKAA